MFSIADEGLREQDEREVLKAGHPSVLRALMDSATASEGLLFTIWVDGKPAGVFGAAPHPVDERVGIPWMLGTDRLLRARRELVRETERWVDYLNFYYPILVNLIDVENTTSLAWLKRVGFDLHETIDVNGHPFRRFTRCATP